MIHVLQDMDQKYQVVILLVINVLEIVILALQVVLINVMPDNAKLDML